MNYLTRRQLHDAYVSFRKLTNSPRNENTQRVFYQFIGLRETPWALNDVVNPSDETANKVAWLTGPNAKFMYKVWKAKYADRRSKQSVKSVQDVGEGDGEG